MSRGDCPGVEVYDKNVDLQRPWVLPNGVKVQIGKGRTHRTHHLRWYKGIFYCRECRHYRQEDKVIKKLAAPCYRQTREHQNIKRINNIERNILPSIVKEWPRPLNIPGEGYKGLLQPRHTQDGTLSTKAMATETRFASQEEADLSAEQAYLLEEFGSCGAGDAFDTYSGEAEPVHWDILDQEPEEWCQPCGENEKDSLGGR